jgi:hypothetical protein
MYRKIASALVLLSISLIAGCHSSNSTPDTSIPVTDKMFPTIRDFYTRDDDSWKVGLVTAVSAGNNLATVSDLNVTDFNIGDYFNFVDSNHKNLTLGKVVSSQGGNLMVQYVAPTEGSRIPRIGDVAIHKQLQR